MSVTTITRENVELSVAGTPPMHAHVVRPSSGGRHPGLMVFQEAFGVNGHIRNVTDRFASQGYVAIAPELFRRTAPPGFEGDYKDFPSVRPHMEAVTNECAQADIRATYDWLRSSQHVNADQISCVGFCMGGKIAFLANAVVPMRAAISFYGGGIAQSLLDRAAKLHGSALLIWGGLDKNITADHRKAVTDVLDAQKKSYVNVVFSTADHGFFCDERPAYDPKAAKQAWALALEFLRS